MEYEIEERLRGEEDEDSALVQDHNALRNQSSVSPSDYPDRKDRALHIPEEGK